MCAGWAGGAASELRTGANWWIQTNNTLSLSEDVRKRMQTPIRMEMRGFTSQYSCSMQQKSPDECCHIFIFVDACRRDGCLDRMNGIGDWINRYAGAARS